MAQQGRNAYRRQLVAEFDRLFPQPLFRGLPVHGNAGWKPRRLLWVSVIMFWLPGKTLGERFFAACRIVKFIHPRWTLPASYNSFVEAQQRWWPLLQERLMQRLRPDESLGDAWRVRGWLLLAVDGSRFECPRTTANEDGLGCAGREKSSPQIFQTLLQHVGSGLPWDYRLGPGTDSERKHLDDLLADLPEHTLLTADAGFISEDLASCLIEQNQRFLLRVGGNKTLIQNLEESETRDNIVYFWTDDARKKSRPPLKLRKVEFPSPAGLPVVLLTNVLDEDLLSDADARELYKSRWGIEIHFRHLKQTMDFSTLDSRTPTRVFNEQHWRLISFWTLQRLTVDALMSVKKSPRKFSAASARREIREVLQLLQLNRRGPSIARRLAGCQTDSYTRRGKKATRRWPSKKQDKPPKPPKLRPATRAEIKAAKQLEIKKLII